MKETVNIRKRISKIFSRAKNDDLLYLFLQLAVGLSAIALPAIAPVAIFIKTFQDNENKYSKKQLQNSFYYFQKRGWIDVQSKQGVASVILTREGEKRARLFGAGKILRDNLTTPGKKWDKKWRIVFFDLKNHKNRERNAIRIMLKRCGFVFLQKSVWVYPHDCSSEIEFVRSFFQLTEKEFRVISTDSIGEDDYLINHFRLAFSA